MQRQCSWSRVVDVIKPWTGSTPTLPSGCSWQSHTGQHVTACHQQHPVPAGRLTLISLAPDLPLGRHTTAMPSSSQGAFPSPLQHEACGIRHVAIDSTAAMARVRLTPDVIDPANGVAFGPPYTSRAADCAYGATPSSHVQVDSRWLGESGCLKAASSRSALLFLRCTQLAVVGWAMTHKCNQTDFHYSAGVAQRLCTTLAANATVINMQLGHCTYYRQIIICNVLCLSAAAVRTG